MTTILIGARLWPNFPNQPEPYSLGVVTDTHFIKCYWPGLEQPTELFAKGSSGLIVRGSPTPRNVVFPDDTVFEDYYPDAAGVAELAVGRPLVNLNPKEVETYMRVYAEEAAKMPDHAAIHSTRDDCHFLVHKVNIAEEGQKAEYESYVAELSPEQVSSLVKGDTDVATLTADVMFVPQGESPDKTDTVYMIDETGEPVAVSKAPPIVEEI